MIIIERKKTKRFSHTYIFPDHLWANADKIHQEDVELVQSHGEASAGTVTRRFEPGFPDNYGVCVGAGCVLPGYDPRDVFPCILVTPKNPQTRIILGQETKENGMGL